MSIAILSEVYSEVRRLAIAGSVVAPGDFRLKKLIEPLKKAGSKAAVFSKVAECAEEVVNATEKTAASSLLNLTSLVCSILYTQGTIGVDGELEPIQSTAITAKRSQVSARTLKPLIEALSSTGSGRLEQVRGAIDAGLFCDLRLVRPAIKAIDDSYGEIADLMAEKVLPTYGQAILGELSSSFDIKGKTGDARRLRLMHRIAPQITRSLVTEALEAGSQEIKVAAIECLGDTPDDLAFLLEQAKAKSKEVRRAAYHALSKLADSTATEILIKAISGKDLELVASAIAGRPFPVLGQIALQRLQSIVQELPSMNDKKKQGEELERCAPLFDLIGDNLDPPAERVLQSFVDSQDSLLKIKSTPGGQDLLNSVVATLAGGRATSLKFLLERKDRLSMEGFVEVFSAAMKSMKPKVFYQTFRGYINRSAKKNSPEYMRHKAVIEGLQAGPGYRWGWCDEEPKVKLDDAWIDDAINADDFSMVVALAQPGHGTTLKYFSKKLSDPSSLSKSGDLIRFAFALINVGHPQTTSFVLDNLNAQLKKKSGYELYHWLELAGKLGADAIGPLEVMIGDPKLSDQLSSRLIDIVAEIRERLPSSTS